MKIDHTDKQPYIVKTMFGMEELLAEEMKTLGALDISTGRRMVSCRGDIELMYKMNLWLRTGLRVLAPIAEFIARSPEELYTKSKKLEWHKLFSVDQTFAIDANVQSDDYRHSHFASLKLKDAIADHFSQHLSKRPNVDTENPDIRLHLHIFQEKISISVDTSGRSLNQRGYRMSGGGAPLNEVLAAAMIMSTGWKGESDFYNPMCGSGTLALEAAMIAANLPPQHLNVEFGFMSMLDFNADVWNKVIDEGKSSVRIPTCKIYASDIEGSQISLTEAHIQEASFEEYIEVEQRDFFELTPKGDAGMLIINPPYGERMKEDELLGMYKRMGDRFKQAWPGFKAWVISSDLSAIKHIGLKPSKKIRLMNGPLECTFNGYELFAGKRADKVAMEKGGNKEHE